MKNIFLLSFLFISSISFAQDEIKYKTAFDNVEQNCDSIKKLEMCYLTRFQTIIERKFNDELRKNNKLSKNIDDNIYLEIEIDSNGIIKLNTIKTKSSDFVNSLKEFMPVLPKVNNIHNFESFSRYKFQAILEFKLKKINSENSDSTNPIKDISLIQTPRFFECKSAENEESNKTCFNNEINKHILKHFKYPRKALNNNISGRTIGNMIINKKGKIENYIIYGADILLQRENLRILKLLPTFIPGKYDGKDVAVSFLQPIKFKLN